MKEEEKLILEVIVNSNVPGDKRNITKSALRNKLAGGLKGKRINLVKIIPKLEEKGLLTINRSNEKDKNPQYIFDVLACKNYYNKNY